jgi:CheY-like chemotaxis protein
VIVADDTAFVRDRFSTALVSAGHRALAVKSAAELLARLRTDADGIDLLVIDLRLPHAGGVELVRTIRKIDAGRIPILVFSGTISSADEVKHLAALGVAGYVNEYSAVQNILPSLAPTSSRTISIAAAVRESCWEFRSRIGSATPSPPRSR